MNETDYSEFAEAPPQQEAFATLESLVLQAQQKEQEVVELAAQLGKAQEQLRDLTWRKIPEHMDSLGLEEFKHRSGLTVGIKEEIDAGISEDRKAAAHKWLDDNGHSGLLKRDVTVSFSKHQEDAANALTQELGGKFSAVTQNMKVHPSSLKAWVKEMLAAGKPLPLETFGVFRRRVAKFSRPRGKR